MLPHFDEPPVKRSPATRFHLSLTALISTSEPYNRFIRVCKNLSHKGKISQFLRHVNKVVSIVAGTLIYQQPEILSLVVHQLVQGDLLLVLVVHTSYPFTDIDKYVKNENIFHCNRDVKPSAYIDYDSHHIDE